MPSRHSGTLRRSQYHGAFPIAEADGGGGFGVVIPVGRYSADGRSG
jgi:hypothetical protein